jgi:2',3'-cyclic-nucleotide 2'-phosphodiesterase / 3'-nucleotidase
VVYRTLTYNGDGEVVNKDAHRITKAMFNGEPLRMKDEFLVATNNYRAGGGGHFPNLNGETIVIDAPDKNRDVVANYLLSQTTINPAADGNWSFTGFGKAKVLFTTSPKAKEAASNNMSYQSLDDNGFAVFQIK